MKKCSVRMMVVGFLTWFVLVTFAFMNNAVSEGLPTHTKLIASDSNQPYFVLDETILNSDYEALPNLAITPASIVRHSDSKLLIMSSSNFDSKLMVYDLNQLRVIRTMNLSSTVVSFDVRFPMVAYATVDSLDTHRISVLDLNTEEIYSIDDLYRPDFVSFGKSDSICIIAQDNEFNQPELYEYNLLENQLTLINDTFPYWDALLGNPSDDYSCFSVAGSMVFLIGWDAEYTFTRLLPFTFSNTSLIANNSNGFLVYNLSDGTMIFYWYDDLIDEKDSLVVSGSFVSGFEPFILAQTMRMFQGTNNNIDVEIRNYGTFTELYDSISRHETEADLFMFSNFDYALFRRNMLLTNLLELREVRNLANDTLNINSWPFSLVGNYEECYALPFYTVIPKLWMVNTDILGQLSLELPDNDWNWFDFFDFIKKVSAKDSERTLFIFSREFTPFLSDYISVHMDYEQANIGFDNSMFRDLCAAWKEVFNTYCHDRREFTPTEENTLFTPTSVTLSNVHQALNYMQLRTPPAFPNEKSMVGAEMRLLGVNTKSLKKDLASKFIEMYYTKDSQLGKSNQNVSSLPIRKMAEEHSSEYLLQRHTMVTQEDWNYYISLLNRTIPRDPLPSMLNYAERVLSDYYLDIITLDEAIHRIESYAEVLWQSR